MSGETEFRYERKKQAYPRMDAWREELTHLLTVDATEPKRQRLTQIRICFAVLAMMAATGWPTSFSLT